MKYNKKWAEKGHTLNSGLISPDEKYFYINIPKNNSSFIKNELSKLDWKFSSLDDHPSAIPIVILRDPLNRWISGIAEYLMMYHINVLDHHGYYTEELGFQKLFGDPLALNLLFTTVTFDDHTEKQTLFLQGIQNLNNVIWFKSDSDFSSTFNKFLNDNGYETNIINKTRRK